MVTRGLFRSTAPRRDTPDFTPERNLAFAVLRQAWNEAVLDPVLLRDESKSDHLALKKGAIEWFFSNNEGFLYWCQLADMDHLEVRHRLREILRSQEPSNGTSKVALRIETFHHTERMI